MKRFTLLIAIIFFGGKSYGQNDTLKTRWPYLEPGYYTIKADLANILNPFDPSILVSTEILLRRNLTFTQELGWVVTVYRNDLDRPILGWKLREELRYYPNVLKGDDQMGYVSLSLAYRNLSARGNFMIGYGCEDDQCDYYENLKKGRMSANRVALTLIGGYLVQFGNRLIFEFDYGIGVQYRFERTPSYSGEGKIHSVERLQNNFHDPWYPHITFTAKLGYLFKK